MRRVLSSGLLLMALSGCGSKPPVPQQCAPMEPFPAELSAEPRNLQPKLDALIGICEEDLTGSLPSCSSAGRN